jgi:hypothetical protein
MLGPLPCRSKPKRLIATLLHGYANPLKTLAISESVNLHKCLILLDSCRIHATRCRKALSIAEEQRAKLWELRAAVSFARLRRDQSRHAEARDLLKPIYKWFTEGFDTPDLKEAKALLNELA